MQDYPRRKRTFMGLAVLLVLFICVVSCKSSVHASPGNSPDIFAQLGSIVEGKSADELFHIAMGHLDNAEKEINGGVGNGTNTETRGTFKKSSGSNFSPMTSILVGEGVNINEAKWFLRSAFDGISASGASTGTRSFSMQNFHQTTVRSANSGSSTRHAEKSYNFFSDIPVKLVNKAQIATGCPVGKCCANPKNLFFSKHLSTKSTAQIVRTNAFLNSVDQSVNDARITVVGGFTDQGHGLVALLDSESGKQKWETSIKAQGLSPPTTPADLPVQVTGVRINPKSGKDIAVIGVITLIDRDSRFPVPFPFPSGIPTQLTVTFKSSSKPDVTFTISGVGTFQEIGFLAHYSCDGNFEGVTFFGDATLRGVAFDPRDEAIAVTGKFRSESQGTIYAFQKSSGTLSNSKTIAFPTSAGQQPAFVAKFSCERKFEWISFISGRRVEENSDIGNGVAVDRDGFISITGAIDIDGGVDEGYFYDRCKKVGEELQCDHPCSPHTVRTPIWRRILDLFLTLDPNSDIFTARYTSEGKFVWAHLDGGVGRDSGLSVAVDSDSSVYITGFYTGIASFGAGILSLMLSSCVGCTILCGDPGTNGFVAKYNAQGSLEWVSRIRANGYESNVFMSSVSVDCRSNRVYATGLFNGKAAAFYSGQDPVTRFGIQAASPFFNIQNERGEAMAFLDNARAYDEYTPNTYTEGSGRFSQGFLASYETSDGTILGVEKAGNSLDSFSTFANLAYPAVIADPICGARVAGSFSSPGALFGDNTFLKGEKVENGDGTTCSLTSSGFLARFEDCLYCPSGNYVDLSCRKCAHCPSGTFSKSLSTKCEHCPAGSQTSKCGQYCQTVEQCPPGKEYDQDKNRCRHCKAGTFKSDFGSQACRLCPENTYSRHGAKVCRPCRSGHRARIGSHKCVRKCSKSKGTCGTCDTCDKNKKHAL